MSEAAEVSVHDVDGHLHRVKMKIVRLGHLQHTQMNRWVLVSGETNVADFSGLFGGENRLVRSFWSEETIWIFETNVLMKLSEIKVISPQAFEALIDLFRGLGACAAIILCH